MRTFKIPHADSAEQFEVALGNVSSDPTGSLPEFQIIETGAGDDDATLSTWVDGAWKTAYDADREVVWAFTPLIGGPSMAIEAGKSYRLMMRVDFGGSHLPIRELGQVLVAGSTDRVAR